MSKSKASFIEGGVGPILTADALRQYEQSKQPVPVVYAMSADEKIRKALRWVVMNRTFFGALALRLKITNRNLGHPTIWTDGRVIAYNEQFVQSRSFEDLCFIIMHEVMHCALGHPYRRGARDMKLWNDSCDHAVNLLLKKEPDLRLPADTMFDDQFSSMSAEQIYPVLYAQNPPGQQPQQQQTPEPQPGQGNDKSMKGEAPEGDSDGDASSSSEGPPGKSGKGKQGKGKGKGKGGAADAGSKPGADQPSEDSGGGAGEDRADERLADSPGSAHGDVLDAGTSGETEPGEDAGTESEPQPAAPQQLSEAEVNAEREDWEAATVSAMMQAEAQGHLSGNVLRLLRESMKRPIPYGEYMRIFAQKTMRDETSWARPSRRSQQYYLPTMRTDRTGTLVIGVDTSGSIGDDEMGAFEQEVRAMHSDLRPEMLRILFCDASVQGEEEIGEHDEPRFIKPAGGGGTKFAPVFERVVELQNEGEEIAGVIYLTDLLGRFPAEAPEVPVLWVCTNSYREAPFGEVVRMHQ